MSDEFTRNGITYKRLQARVERPCEWNTRDFFIGVTVEFVHEEGNQCFAPAFNPKFQRDLALAMDFILYLQRYTKAWRGFVLCKNGIIEGTQDLEIDGGEIFLRSEFVAAHEAKPHNGKART